ncbi:hypothetical protein [Marinoscillum sp.]|uniref:hypothetical protein n=1 Tax=Marinoscillum sp. TaxID=2024838 RepID=UPI003BAA4354
MALSKCPYGVFPSSVKSNLLFQEWIRNLHKNELKPQFKIFEKVKNKDCDSIFDMYLGLFKSWGFRLYNDQVTLKIPPFKDAAASAMYEGKFLIQDFGFIHQKLAYITNELATRKYSLLEKSFTTELIILCHLNIDLSICWKKIITTPCSKILTLLEYDSYKHKYLNHIIEYWEYKEVEAFPEIKDMNLSEILNSINYLFACFRVNLFFNKQVWDNAFDLYSYLDNVKEYNKKYEVVELFSELQRDMKNVLKQNEFDLIHQEIISKY